MLTKYIERNLLNRYVNPIGSFLLAHPQSKTHEKKATVYYEKNRISFSQIYPFIFYKNDFLERYNIRIRFIDISNLANKDYPTGVDADIILIQPWFTYATEAMVEFFDKVRRLNNSAKIVFLDSYAHNDLRWAKYVEPYISIYVKKSLFKDKQQYLKAFRGDTNLTEYYGNLFNIQSAPVDWEVPEAILKKLHLCPHFFTDPKLMNRALAKPVEMKTEEFLKRDINIHARMAYKGSKWYESMRKSALDMIQKVEGLQIPTTNDISFQEFQAELNRSQFVFSPFGYGELCWRDIEAIIAGAVLIKPDVTHLETRPNLFENNVTYLPVNWDFSNLEEVVEQAMANPELCNCIRNEAYNRVFKYLEQKTFVEDMAILFETNTVNPK